MSVTRKLTKNEKRRNRNRENKNDSTKEINTVKIRNGSTLIENESAVEYVSVDYGENFDGDRQLLEQFLPIFEKFAKPEILISSTSVTAGDSTDGTNAVANLSSENQLEEVKKLSKRQKKLANRLSAAELKQLVARPDAVEAHDVTSSDPRLLVYLKSYRNTVPVPRHWCAIRKYLQGKRGVEKVPFQLPEFIAETGIAKIRESVIEQEALKKGKQKQRARVKPTMGKIDIDYQVLHDAFFKYQTKPKMTGHGDLYYEGKEFEVNMKERRPGVLSAELLAALAIQDGGPPPWLIHMQRYGMPPSYPNLKIPGLNAPLPAGASFGYQTGGWGKPPTDEYGRPLYGDVFGVNSGEEAEQMVAAVDKTTRWGALEAEEEQEEEDDEEEEEEEGAKPSRAGAASGRSDTSGAETPNTLDGISSLVSGMETPDTIDLRKRAGAETPDTVYSAAAASRELYTVIQEKSAQGNNALGQMFGSDRTYVLPGRGDVTLSLDPEQLEDMMRDKERLKDAHDAASASIDHQSFGKAHSSTSSSSAVAGDDVGASKKRKAEPSASVKKMKEFKF